MAQQSNRNIKSESTNLLQGIKVLDLSRVLAGPWATQLLADYGATVWKVEKPGTGDDTRHWGPPFLNNDNEQLSAYFIAANRGKKSIGIDFDKPAGQVLIRKLAAKADILVENFKVSGLKQYGLDYASLSQVNPKLIYCSITGFGQNGPMAGAPGYDAMIQASGGLMSVTGVPQEEGGEPQKVGVAVTDLMAGMYATTAILAALNYRNINGKGQYIDLALFDTQLAMLANQGMNYLVSGEIPQRQGNSHPNIVPYQSFSCLDGDIMLAVGNDSQFTNLCEELGAPELAVEEKFSTNTQRVINRHLLVPLLKEIIAEKKRTILLENLTRINVPCGPVNNVAQAFAHPQAQSRELQFSLHSNRFGEVPQVANPVKFSQSKLNYSIAPPALGEDTSQVLEQELGECEAEIERLKKTGVIQV